MKLGIVGIGNVGCAIALAAVTRGSACEIVLVNRTGKTAEAVCDRYPATAHSPQKPIFGAVITTRFPGGRCGYHFGRQRKRQAVQRTATIHKDRLKAAG